jgi:hypothetical protein
MSRSGTSLTTRLLSVAGVYLGPDDDLLGGELRQLPKGDRESAREANPEGFWEHYRLMRLNERILHRLGGNWRDPPSLLPGWEEAAELDEEREEARALLNATFAGHPLWGWKDPRNCLTLPFWQPLLPKMRYVICLRNPIDVAASLQHRDGISLEQAVELWLAYVSHALINTSGEARLFVSYEDFFNVPEATASSLVTFAGCEGAFEDPARAELLAEAVDERLWRHRTSGVDLARDPRVPAEVVALHQLTSQLT